MIGMGEINSAFDVSKVSETYPGTVEITDLKEELGTGGHLLVVRGDLAYTDRLGENSNLANPKFWLYENLINSQRIQKALQENPDYKLFDGVGFSALEAIGYHAKQLGREALVVMTYEHMPDDEVFERYPLKVIHGDKRAEEGYVEKQAEVLSSRDDLIPLHQALYGAQALAPIGNKIVQKLEEMCIIPDETFWCLASGSNLYGIGLKIKEKFGSRLSVVEPSGQQTIDPGLDLSDPDSIKEFSKCELRNYTMSTWDYMASEMFPLHVAHANRYLLLNWLSTGKTGFDRTIRVDDFKATRTQRALKRLNLDYDWTNTTALTLLPAIEAAKEGKNVLVMVYGKKRKHKYRGAVLKTTPPWLFRWETPAQKIALTAATLALMVAGAAYAYTVYTNPDIPAIHPM
jgi:hypothetical protein